MLTYITLALAKLGQMFGSDPYQSRLEHFIEARNPTNAAEVDYYIREYDRRRGSAL